MRPHLSRSTPCGLVAALLLTVGLHAQTATWIGPGSPATSPQDWFNPANWDTGVVPNGSADIAAFHVVSPGLLATQAGGTAAGFTGSVTLAEIRYLSNPGALPPGTTVGVPGIIIGQPGAAASSLDLLGPGFTLNATYNLIAPRVDIVNATLTFHNQASALNNNFVLSAGATIVFADQSSAGSSSVGFGTPGGHLIVRDNADVSGVVVNGQGLIDLSGATRDVTFTAINNGIDVNLGANRLILDRLPNNTIDQLTGKISGTGGIVFSSTTNSILVITNPANDYTGETLISSNPARVVFANGTRVNDVRVTNNALVNIGATATVTGRLDLDYGRLQLSDNGVAATLTVQGDYTQGPDSVLTVNSVLYPSLVITGTATLAGRLTGAFAAAPAIPSLGSARVNLITAGQISGTFAAGSAGGFISQTRTSRLEYTPTAVQFVVEQLPFAGAGTTPSQRAVGANIDANLVTAAGAYRDIVVSLNNYADGTRLAAALGELSPDTYGVLVEEGFTAAAAEQARRDDTLASARASGTRRGFGFFAEGGWRRDRFDAVAGLWDTRHTTRTLTAGGLWSADRWTTGLTLARAKTSTALDPFGSAADTEGFTAAALVQHVSGSLFQNAAIAYTDNRFSLTRRVVYPTLNRTFTAAPGGSRVDGSANVGYARTRGRGEITVLAGVLASTWKIDDFDEAGAAGAPLGFRDWSADSLRSRVGVQLEWHASRGFAPHLSVMWLHEFKPDRAIPASFTGATLGFISPGRPGETDLVQASLGVDYALGHGGVFYAGCSGAQGRNSSVAADVSAGFRWEF